MGVHESNHGLCEALHRAFETMQCVQKLASASEKTEGNYPLSPPPSTAESSDSHLLSACSNLLRRLILRQCQIPLLIQDADWFDSEEIVQKRSTHTC